MGSGGGRFVRVVQRWWRGAWGGLVLVLVSWEGVWVDGKGVGGLFVLYGELCCVRNIILLGRCSLVLFLCFRVELESLRVSMVVCSVPGPLLLSPRSIRRCLLRRLLDLTRSMKSYFSPMIPLLVG